MQRTNEHYLPRFLMRGFASHIRGEEVKTWWFREGIDPKETNIRNIAAEKDFHSSDSGCSADDSIKPLEDQFGWYLDSLRQQKTECRLDDAVVPELVGNLTVRTKAFREGLTRSTAIAMREVIARLRDTEQLNKIVSVRLGDPSGRLLKPLASKLADKFSPEYADTFIEQLPDMIAFMRSPLGSLLSKIQLEKVEKAFESDFPRAAKESHVHALSQAPVPETVIAALAHLHWHLVIHNPGSFILGDVGPVFKIENSIRSKSAPVGVYDYDAAFLPISDSHLIAGLEDERSPVVGVEQVNRFSSSCSQTFFISAFNTVREQNYALQLGSSADLLDKDTMPSLVEHVLSLLQSL